MAPLGPRSGMLLGAVWALTLLAGFQGTAAQDQATDWSCAAESNAAAAAGASCPTFTDTSCSGIFSQPPEVGGRTASYLASLLADMAYDRQPTTGATWEDTARTVLRGWGATDVQFISITHDDKEARADTQVVVANTPAAVLVFFRGTEESNMADIQTDLSTTFMDVPGLGGVHEGFFEAEHVAHADVAALIDRFRAGSNDKPVVFAGHSLGGALAKVAAARQQLAIPNSVGAVYTFGAPRVGDAAWADAYEQLGLSSITHRYVLGKDPVPLLPPGGDIGFVHVGQQRGGVAGVAQAAARCDGASIRISADGCASDEVVPDYCAGGSPVSGTLTTIKPESVMDSLGVWLAGRACANKEGGSIIADVGASIYTWWKGLEARLSPSDLTRNVPGICCSVVDDHSIAKYTAAVRAKCMDPCNAIQLCLCNTFFLQPQAA